MRSSIWRRGVYRIVDKPPPSGPRLNMANNGVFILHNSISRTIVG